MDQSLIVGLLALAFVGTHLGLAMGGVRDRLVARIGERGFLVLYSLVSAITYSVLVSHYSSHRFEGRPGLGLADAGPARIILMGVIGFGVALAAAGLARYSTLPVALFRQPIRGPRGVERVTRHPFFVGLALLAVAHALLARFLTGTIFFAFLALLSLAGAWHQDRKHLARRVAYGEYLATTSIVPFGAILAGRQQLVLGELPWRALAIGAGVAVLLRLVHASILAHHGIYAIVALLGGAAGASLSAGARARKRRLARRADAPGVPPRADTA